MQQYKDFGTMSIVANTTAELIVDATFNKIINFTGAGEVNKMTVDTTNNEITIATTGTYLFIGNAKFNGGAKTFTLEIFINGVDTGLGMTDRADGTAGGSTTLSLTAGDVIDARQKALDGGTSLTITQMSITFERLI